MAANTIWGTGCQAESELQAAGGIDQKTRSGMTAQTSAGVANQDGVISLFLQHKAAAVNSPPDDTNLRLVNAFGRTGQHATT